MNTVMIEALALLLGTVGAAAVIGGFRWVRAVTLALHKLTDVAAQLGGLVEAQAEQGRLIRSIQRELRLHVRDCDHAAALARPEYAGPDRRRAPRPRLAVESTAGQQ